MQQDYALSLEEIKRMMANAGGTNLAGQSMAGPVATGQSYAQSIAGGMPMSQVIAPGVSYSPDQPGGYTQADLDFLARGPAPVMPIAPTTGEVATIDNQMSYAPPGVTEPTRWTPGQTPFPGMGNFDFLKGLDFSNLPDFSNIDVDTILKDYQDRQDAGEPEPFESFFTEPSQVPVMPSAPVYQEPVYQEPVYQEPVYQIPNFPIQQPMNFTGLPQILPQMQAPYIPPQMQAPAYVQPRVEDIIAPIRTGSTRRVPQPGLFNLR
jgi:hypothetical protein